MNTLFPFWWTDYTDVAKAQMWIDFPGDSIEAFCHRSNVWCSLTDSQRDLYQNDLR